eukprot:3244712-Amphidinium_carterae.1
MSRRHCPELRSPLAHKFPERVGRVMSGSIVTSAAYFDELYFDEFIKGIGLADSAITNLKAQGFTTLSALAYAIPPVLGDDANNGRKATLRRALHESYALAVAHVRNMVERADDRTPAKMPVAEREAQRSAQASRLAGVDITGVNEPSRKVLERVCEFVESGELKYEPWSYWMSRDQEVKGIKTDENVITLEKG